MIETKNENKLRGEIFDNNQFMEHRWEFVRDIIKDMINKQSTHLI